MGMLIHLLVVVCGSAACIYASAVLLVPLVYVVFLSRS